MINFISENKEKAFEKAVYLLTKYGKDIPGGEINKVTFIKDESLIGDTYIINANEDCVTVTGNTPVSFNGAVGYLLRHRNGKIKSETVTYNSDFRAVYFANHFHNYYHSAPTEEVLDYIESLALWGQNTLCLWFDMHHFESISSPDAKAMLTKMEALFKKAKSLGMKTSLTHLANEYYVGADKEYLAENSTENGKYNKKLVGYYYTELCPSLEGGEKLLLASFKELLSHFSAVGLDNILFWPYDQGGCTCDKCYPWGSKGFYDIAEKKAKIAREIFPDINVILSLWRFDYFTTGEWEGVIPRLLQDKENFNMLMVDIDSYIPEEITKLGKPILSFPEISMYHATPWGGFGANPFPNALKRQFNNTKSFCRGGMLYSEGIFEDINKAFALELMRNPDADMKEVAKEYLGFHFGFEAADELSDIVLKLEETLFRRTKLSDGRFDDYPSGKIESLHTYVFDHPEKIEEIYLEFSEIDKKINPSAKENHRYKSLYARIVGDFELWKNGGVPSDETDKIYEELVKAYHAENAYYFVSPVTRESILSNRGEGV